MMSEPLSKLERAIWDGLEPFLESHINLDLNDVEESAQFRAMVRAIARNCADIDTPEWEKEARKERPVCEAFMWLGQSFKHCDKCGHPFWVHTHDRQRDRDVPITPEWAERVREAWE